MGELTPVEYGISELTSRRQRFAERTAIRKQIAAAVPMPQKCADCMHYILREWNLTSEIMDEKLTLEQAAAQMAAGNAACRGTSYPVGIADAQPICDIEQQENNQRSC